MDEPDRAPHPPRALEVGLTSASLLLASGLLAALAWRAWGLAWLAGAVAAPGVGLGLLLAAAPPLRGSILRAMRRAGRPLGLVVTALALGVVFLFLLTPLAWALRLSGRDVLGRRLSPEAATYWEDLPEENDPDQPFRQH